MNHDLYLGEFEQIVLLALLRVGPDAYGVPVRQEIERRTGRDITLGAIYKTLRRMEEKGYVASREGEPTAERGGRRKKFYRLEPLGLRALNHSLAALKQMTRGLEKELKA
ncbi:MAG TPA: helix-turn-helix transcriptional regulator [Candidatus Acidoferrales bacterium]